MESADRKTGTVFLVGGNPDDHAQWQKRLAQIPSCHPQSVTSLSYARENDGIVCLVHPDGSATIITPEEIDEIGGTASRSHSMTQSMDDDQIAALLLCAAERVELQRELASARKAMSEFCHLAAHDLKAPARRIAQFCDILKEEATGTLSEECANYIERITINAARMQNLIGEILAFSEASAPQEERQSVDMKALLHNVANTCKSATEGKDGIIDIGIMPVAVTGYPAALELLFRNLIENSLKYRGKETPVIRIACDETDREFVFMVSDNGEGIDEKFHERIFKPLERLHTQDEIEGSGLGLAICEKIAAMHGGKIWLERSAPGKGSVFRVAINKG